MTSERDGLKAKLKKTELELEQIKTENQGFREERDRLRKRVGTVLLCVARQSLGTHVKRQSIMSYCLLAVSYLCLWDETPGNFTCLEYGCPFGFEKLEKN